MARPKGAKNAMRTPEEKEDPIRECRGSGIAFHASFQESSSPVSFFLPRFFAFTSRPKKKQ